MKIQEAIKLFMSQLSVEPVTEKDYRLILTRLLKTFPDADIDELDGELLELFLNEKDVSYVTFNNYRRHLNVFFRFLWRKRFLRHNPVDYISPRKPNRTRGEMRSEEKSKYLPREMRQFLLERFERQASERDYLITALLVETGARPIEILRLEQSMTFDNFALLVRTKNHNPRYVFYPPSLGERIKGYQELVRGYNYLFPAIIDPSKPGSYWNYKDVFNEVSEGMLQPETQRRVTPYMLRHSWFTDRAPLFTTLEMQKFGDHADVRTTQKYFHPTREQLFAMHERAKHLAFL